MKYLFIIAAGLFLSCGNGAQNKAEKIERGGTVRIAVPATFGEIFPLHVTEFNMRQISEYLLTPSLIRYDNDGQPQPNLASVWQISSDNLSIMYILNAGLRWSNGDTLTTDDIKYTYDLLKGPQINCAVGQKFRAVQSLEIIDRYSFRFKFSRPVADPVYTTKIPILPSVWNAPEINNEDLKITYFEKFIGCGPFLLKSVKGDSVVCERNPYFPEDQPYVDKIVFYFYEQRKKIEKKNIHLYVDVPITIVNQMKKDSSYTILSYPERGYSFVGWNLKNSLFTDLRVRKALTNAIDRETIVDGVLSGFSTIINGPTYPNFWANTDRLVTHEFNPALADSLLDAAGWLSGPDGVRMREGKKFRFSLLVNSENPVRQAIAANIKSNLKTVGIELDIKIVEWNRMVQAARNKRYDAILLTWVDEIIYDPSSLFHSVAIDGGLNFTSYANSKADSYIEKGLNSMTRVEREHYWQKFQELLARDLPCTFLFSQDIINGVSTRLKNVRMDSRGYLVNAKEWWLSTR